MCGIGGILRIHPPGAYVPPADVAIPDKWLDIIDDAVQHRGPDGHGRFQDRFLRADGTTIDVALVHRRLAIIDPVGGEQPMVLDIAGPASPNHRIAVVFNGCLYEHRELRRRLELAGHRFQTHHSDTEVWLHGWRQRGPGFWQKLRDWMGAVAIWDSTSGLFIARDRFGEKPLYMLDSFDGPVWAFASTAAALARLTWELGATPCLDALGLGDWLRYGCDPELTPLRGIVQLPAATAMFIPHATPAGPREVLHAEVSPEIRSLAGELAGLEGQPLADRIEAYLEAAVAQRLEADVPLGCFLSGGVDSSLIASAARRQAGRLSTICIRMPDQRYDESAYAEQVARVIGSQHITVDADASPAADLVRLIETMGLPFGDSSLLPTWWAAAAAAKHMRVVLTGDGADELFLGYQRHIAMRLLPFATPVGAVLGREAVLPRGHPKSRREKIARFLTAARHHGYADLVAIFPTPEWQSLVGGAPGAGGAQPGEALLTSNASAASPLDARRIDIERHLPADMLRKVDFATMAAGLEARAPFLAPGVADAALVLSRRQLMPIGQRKGLLRMIARKYLPHEIVDRPKMGFAIPIGEWFRSDYQGMKQLLLDHLESAEPWGALPIELNRRYICRMIGEHMQDKRDHSQRLYMLLVLSIWARWVGG
jgi:asparagine synthase (glutamine-hydrolysing)